MKIRLMTHWINKELECCCPIKNQCKKNHSCEELEFTLNPYEDIGECMKHDSYKRIKGALRQK